MASLTTADGVRLDAHHDPGERGLAVVMAHGFAGSWRRPAWRRMAGWLNQPGFGVLSFDFRGHGRSTGVSTVGDQEVLDLAAAVDWAGQLGYRRVATLGFSMGAAVAVRHAGLVRVRADQHTSLAPSSPRPAPVELTMGHDAPPLAASGDLVAEAPSRLAAGPDTAEQVAVVAVSGPSRWYYRGTAPMRRVHWVLEHRVGRLVSRIVLRTRISEAGWTPPLPAAPHEVAGHIAPVPLLIVHGDADRYFPVEHAQALYDAAAEPKELWIEAGLGHSENAISGELAGRIAGWLADRCPPDEL
jgi:pimeloyl-ACP methyl ester carboxylesterase